MTYKVLTLLAFSIALSLHTASAQWAVFDAANYVETTLSAAKNAAGVAEQAKQYANQLQNTKSLGTFTWATSTTALNQGVGTVSSAGNFNTFSQWSTTPPTVATYQQQQTANSSTQAAANAATVANLQKQNANMAADNAKLTTMSQSAQSATGQVQAVQATAQIATYQASQLGEVRALLVHIADMTAARNGSKASEEAAQAAAFQQASQTEGGTATPIKMTVP